MRFAVSSLTLLAVLGLAACANNPNRPTDTGSMQQQAPGGAGTVSTARPGFDTGSMQQQQGYGGTSRPVSGVGLTPTDTGSMQTPRRGY